MAPRDTGPRACGWTTLSAAHHRPDLRAGNPLYDRAGSTRCAFEPARCPLHARALLDAGRREAARRRTAIGEAMGEAGDRAARRGSFMVRRQQPKPVPRPSPSLALGPDRAAFDAQWTRELRAARKAAFIAARQSGPAREGRDPARKTGTFNRQSRQ